MERVDVTVEPEAVTFEVTISGGSATTYASPGNPSMVVDGVLFEVRGIKGDEAVVVLTGA
ncbi:hypothetical protein [Actinomadura algeriensis]|uniref:Uncharacterized protein n=1 Tax=Actinomadura algeriensis TaxID=1679523 RepID=A0ABR9JSC7_9ACTN|nr:hypothetical protein [Actinomadura algeriensis]MBE1533466.1 hypothetical protein [Actinomadura algeriensis]